ncbi:hypothetical protein Slip_0179 [Syntrophothermus lipocalidus DSM 12680]|uniref:Uncharacterized protein n=1 Tax=Syntrophothermus lipocalidus (strain DSM 12680 / TGB-C1) TaxID=643648 RepID=D7CJ89_SYNLT|nr:hypothetical protein Slip_0179 [Syntrophothermus lipocalidus DSM 12680]
MNGGEINARICRTNIDIISARIAPPRYTIPHYAARIKTNFLKKVGLRYGVIQKDCDRIRRIMTNIDGIMEILAGGMFALSAK